MADYGDAPDPSFPSRFASNGAHTLDITQFWLGDLASPSVTAEADANVIDRDPLDDGLEAMKGESGGTGLTFRAVKAASAPGGTVYFNLLVDLDHDGRWRGSDWVTVNRAVPMTPGQSVAIASDVLLGALFDTWIRATLTDTPVDASAFPGGWDGTGSFAAGEVEDYDFPTAGPPPTPEPTPTDYVLTPTPGGRPTPSPSPTPAASFIYTGNFVPACDKASLLHGESVFVPIRLTSGQQTPPERFGAGVEWGRSDEGTQVATTPPGEPYWAPWGDGAGFTFTSTAVDPPDRRDEYPVIVLLQSRATTRVVTCTVEVHHLAATPSATTATTPTLEVDPHVVTRGGLTTALLKVTGAGFTPNGKVTETLVRPDGTRSSSAVHADAQGSVVGTLPIAPNQPAGTWTLQLLDDTTGATAMTTFAVK